MFYRKSYQQHAATNPNKKYTQLLIYEEWQGSNLSHGGNSRKVGFSRAGCQQEYYFLYAHISVGEWDFEKGQVTEGVLL